MVSSRLRTPHALAALAVVGSALVVLPASTARADTFTAPDFHVCDAEPYNVPSNVLAVDVVVIGQEGVVGLGNVEGGTHGGGVGGHGGKVTAHLPVTPGETLWAAMGCFYGAQNLANIPGDDGRGGSGSGIFTTTVNADPSNRLYWTTLVIAGSNCGMAPMRWDIALGKLAALGKGAQLARKQFGGSST